MKVAAAGYEVLDAPHPSLFAVGLRENGGMAENKMGDKPKDEEVELSMPRKTAQEVMKALGAEYLLVSQKLIDLHVDPFGDSIPVEYFRLSSRQSQISKQMAEIREWYSVNVLESINTYSRELRWLTVGLAFLTSVLALETFILLLRTFR